MPPSQLTPDIMQALMARRQALGGGSPTPAAAQVMQMSPLGGPMGPSQTPLPQSPVPSPAGSMPQGPLGGAQGGPNPAALLAALQGGQGGPGQAQRSGQPQQPAQVDEGTKAMTKALMQRLLRYV